MWSGSGAPFDSARGCSLTGMLGISFIVFSLVALENAVRRLTKLAKKAWKGMRRMGSFPLFGWLAASGGFLTWTRCRDLRHWQ